jgi:hypothetical protein
LPTLLLTWHAVEDAKTCPICQAVDGYTWKFEMGKDILIDALFHPVYGIIWSLSQGSNAHAHGYGQGQRNNCRCQIEPDIDYSDWVDKCDYLVALAHDVPDTKGGSYRTTTAEDIGIDLSKYGIGE